MPPTRRAPRQSFLREHSLSLMLAGLLAFLWVMYSRSDPQTHWGAFYANAVADWLGVFAFVVATKYFFETGSGESRNPSGHARHLHARAARFLLEHSLTIVLALTLGVWVALYVRSDANTKGGQLLGNIVSAWAQLLGLVLLTKYARERGSKEGH